MVTTTPIPEQNSEPRLNRVLASVFTVLGGIAVAAGAIGISTALFVGPHILTAVIGEIILGALSLVTARGLRQSKYWSWWCSIILTLVLGILVTPALIQSIISSEQVNSIFYGALTVVILVLFIAVVRLRSQLANAGAVG